MQTSAFEVYVLGLLAVLERLPIPIAVAFDPACERVQGNRAFRRLLGLSTTENASVSPEQRAPRFRMTKDGEDIPPEQLPLRRAASEGVDVLEIPLQLERTDGAMRALQCSAWPLRNSNGEIEGSIGVLLDLTERSEAEKRAEQAMRALLESERRYRLITEAMPQFVWLDGPDGSAIYANRRWLDYTGLTPDQNSGFGWEQVVHPEDKSRLEHERARTLSSGDVFEGESRYRGKDGKYRWFIFRSIPVRDENGLITSWLGTATDIDQQKRAQAQQTFFALASDVLGSTLDVSTTLDRIARLAIDALGTWCQIDLPDDDGRLRVAVVAHQDAQKRRTLGTLIGRNIYAEGAQFGPPAVFDQGQPQLLPRIKDDVVIAVIPDAAVRDVYREVGYAGGLMVPLRSGSRVLGVLGIASDDPTRLYTGFDVTTALELGRRGGAALANAQSYAREHRVATTLQRALLPGALPSAPNLQFYSAYAAQSLEQGEAVGGDWYDAFPLDEHRVAISMGDVAGHGVDAAVTMSIVRQTIRATAYGGRSVREILDRANAMVALEKRAPMVTALFGVYDMRARSFTYCLAGHLRPMYVDDLGNFRTLPGSGAPLGDAFDLEHLREQTVDIATPGTVVFYTDGLIEYSRDIVGATARLERAVQDRFFLSEPNPAQGLIDTILDGPQRDDIAVLVMRTNDPLAPSLHLAMPAVGRSAPIVRERLQHYAAAKGYTGDALSAILDATGEALAKAIERAHSERGDRGTVRIDAVAEYGRMEISVTGSGAPVQLRF